MQLQIHAPFSVSDSLDKHIWTKVEKLQTYFDRIERADVYLKTGDSRVPDGRIAEISIAIPGNDLYADATSDTYEKAVNDAAEKVGRQLKKVKEKMRDRG